MQTFQTAVSNNKDNVQEKKNPLSKSAGMLSTRDLILSLNDSFIREKSKEYNFDFAKASASSDNYANGTLSVPSNQFCYNSNIHETPKEHKLTARKTVFDSVKVCDLNTQNISKNNNNNNNCTNFIFNSEKNNNNQSFLNCELKSKQNLGGNFVRCSTNDSLRKLKQKLQLLQQKKKLEFFEANSQNQELKQQQNIKFVADGKKQKKFFE